MKGRKLMPFQCSQGDFKGKCVAKDSCFAVKSSMYAFHETSFFSSSFNSH